MNTLFGYRKKRFAAAAMLFIWLLAVGTGIANACLVQEQHARHGHLDGRHAQAGPLPFSATGRHGVVHDLASATVSRADGQEDRAGVIIACGNFCAAGQTGAIKHQVEKPAAPDITPVLLGACWRDPPSFDPICSPQRFRNSDWPDPPAFIRFLRLTL